MEKNCSTIGCVKEAKYFCKCNTSEKFCFLHVVRHLELFLSESSTISQHEKILIESISHSNSEFNELDKSQTNEISSQLKKLGEEAQERTKKIQKLQFDQSENLYSGEKKLKYNGENEEFKQIFQEISEIKSLIANGNILLENLAEKKSIEPDHIKEIIELKVIVDELKISFEINNQLKQELNNLKEEFYKSSEIKTNSNDVNQEIERINQLNTQTQLVNIDDFIASGNELIKRFENSYSEFQQSVQSLEQNLADQVTEKINVKLENETDKIFEKISMLNNDLMKLFDTVNMYNTENNSKLSILEENYLNQAKEFENFQVFVNLNANFNSNDSNRTENPRYSQQGFALSIYDEKIQNLEKSAKRLEKKSKKNKKLIESTYISVQELTQNFSKIQSLNQFKQNLGNNNEEEFKSPMIFKENAKNIGKSQINNFDELNFNQKVMQLKKLCQNLIDDIVKCDSENTSDIREIILQISSTQELLIYQDPNFKENLIFSNRVVEASQYLINVKAVKFIRKIKITNDNQFLFACKDKLSL